MVSQRIHHCNRNQACLRGLNQTPKGGLIVVANVHAFQGNSSPTFDARTLAIAVTIARAKLAQALKCCDGELTRNHIGCMMGMYECGIVQGHT